MFAILESDWKKFKPLHALAMDRFFQKTNAEIAQRILSTQGTHQDRFWNAHEFACDQRKEAAELFDDPRRSSALLKLAAFCRQGLLTPEEISPLTPETRQFIVNILQS